MKKVKVNTAEAKLPTETNPLSTSAARKVKKATTNPASNPGKKYEQSNKKYKKKTKGKR